MILLEIIIQGNVIKAHPRFFVLVLQLCASARDYNNVWNVNANESFEDNNFWNDGGLGVRPAFHKTEDFVISIYSEKI